MTLETFSYALGSTAVIVFFMIGYPRLMRYLDRKRDGK